MVVAKKFKVENESARKTTRMNLLIVILGGV